MWSDPVTLTEKLRASPVTLLSLLASAPVTERSWRMDITLTFLGFGLGVCEQKVLNGSTLKYSVPVTR
jgi:hypothetical protein